MKTKFLCLCSVDGDIGIGHQWFKRMHEETIRSVARRMHEAFGANKSGRGDESEDHVSNC